jgi:hypothetical protein
MPQDNHLVLCCCLPVFAYVFVCTGLSVFSVLGSLLQQCGVLVYCVFGCIPRLVQGWCYILPLLLACLMPFQLFIHICKFHPLFTSHPFFWGICNFFHGVFCHSETMLVSENVCRVSWLVIFDFYIAIVLIQSDFRVPEPWKPDARYYCEHCHTKHGNVI